MAKGSEQPTWAWTKARHCEKCGAQLLLKDIGRFHYESGEHSIRCRDCVNTLLAAAVEKRRKEMGLPT